MYCPKCATGAIDGTKFCRGCGTDLEAVAAVLRGELTLSKGKKQNCDADEDSNDPDKLWSNFITNALTGAAFITIALFLMITNTIGGSVWGFWLLIPGGATLGRGIASYLKAKRIERRNSNAGFAPSYNLPTAPLHPTLPPPINNTLPPARPTLFDEFAARNTGELVAPPASITENTTRHLQLDDQGESVYQPREK